MSESIQESKLSRTTIVQYPFSDTGFEMLKNNAKGSDWPIVYILQGKDHSKPKAYVGETSNAINRMTQHLADPRRSCMAKEYVLFNDTFNKSAILDIENMLIDHMHADGQYELQNLNNGQSKYHNYYQRGLYKNEFANIWKKLISLGLAKQSLLAIENSNIYKYSPFKQLTDEQYELEKKLLEETTQALKQETKKTIIIEGGAGTGKSILAISFIKYMVDYSTQKIDYSEIENIDDLNNLNDYLQINAILSEQKDLKIALVAPVTEFRNTIKATMKNLPDMRKHVKVLSPNELAKSPIEFDIVIVDEAHHLATYGKSTSHKGFKLADKALGFTDYKNTTQLDWVKKKANKILIMFYDRKQSTSGADVPEKVFDALLNEPNTCRFSIEKQIRMKCGEEYIRYWNDLLHNNTTENAPDISDTGYDFRIYDDCKLMLEDIKQKDKENNGLCRVLSGYGFEFTKTMRDKKGKNATRDYDFIIDGEKYKWNPINGNYATDPSTIGLIGSVITSQGFDLNYAGVIFSNDIRFNKSTGKIEAVAKNYRDKHGKVGTDISKTIEDILNSYLVLLTRGIKGTYIYACDPALRQYLKDRFISITK